MLVIDISKDVYKRQLLASFARYVASRHHRGPLTVELMADWARCDKGNKGSPGTWARRLALLRHFARYLKPVSYTHLSCWVR